MCLGKTRKANRSIGLAGGEVLATADVYIDVEGFLKEGYWINQRRE